MSQTYDDIILLSAGNYLKRLISLAETKSETARPIFQSLVETYQAGLEKRESLAVEDVFFDRQMLERLSMRKRARLINQYSLGLGAPDAPVIFMGTEHAYSVSSSLPYTLEAVGLTLLWLCGGKAEVTSKISGIPWEYNVPFHIHPNTLYKVHKRKGLHTWKVLASIMGMAVEGVDASRLLSEYTPGLGGLTYQVEMSAYPSKLTRFGAAPKPERVVFLDKLLTVMRETARVLVFHGKMRDEEWAAMRGRLARRFFGIDDEELLDFQTELIEGVEARYYSYAGRRVILTRALSRDVSDAYQRVVAAWIKEML